MQSDVSDGRGELRFLLGAAPFPRFNSPSSPWVRFLVKAAPRVVLQHHLLQNVDLLTQHMMFWP